ncbi:MAG: tRNA (adenosine(37)-N6)-threonylcarbamoyltransferase complex transferase subunit TsaD [Clostridiales Family XIII bacterium]|jgi:N6-L-threonylcarbamoyladenine synthase|nr:tRNA (adenosine(37)-N6)-threonylcarbamoyltransferase complex transferase subunit TsaD [Clostridiales Family XIII bacterium]
MKNGKFITLGIETSCDETAAAVTANGRDVLSNIIASQIDVHKVFGGVVPEIASRHHLTQINAVMDAALAEAGVAWRDIDLVGATKGPGLVGAVLIGLSTAKAVAYAAGKPLAATHHIKGHVCASYLNTVSADMSATAFDCPDVAPKTEASELSMEYSIDETDTNSFVSLGFAPETHSQTAGLHIEPPHLALVVSGGHTDLIDVRSYTEYKLLGHTRDDAVGEAFDKVARVLGLGYPGGPKIDEIAKNGNPNAVEFKRVYLEEGSLDFSFSGIKTAVLNYINTERQAATRQKETVASASQDKNRSPLSPPPERDVNVADIAASFEASVVDVITAKTRAALRSTGYKKLTMGGGVAANSMLRERIASLCADEGVELYAPQPIYCTDNAAMIACAAYYQFKEQGPSPLDTDAYATLPLQI